MNETASQLSIPPYISYRVFEGYLDMIARDGIPARVDPSSMSGLPRATQGQLRAALVYLGLVNEALAPMSAIHQLLESDGEERRSVLRALILLAYAPVLGQPGNGFDLASATREQLSSLFKAAGANGDTARKCQAFFLAAARAAGLQVSRYMKPARRRVPGIRSAAGEAGRARRRVRRTGDGEAESRYPLTSTLGTEAPSGDGPTGAGYIVRLLVEKFPPYHPNLSGEAQIRWYDAYERLLEFVDRYLGQDWMPAPGAPPADRVAPPSSPAAGDL